ncbi:uncharacterized protein LOC134233399 [Saccostrea cucullata]|uniref:uncharacterized protein LOC134233399 n=1 Tax=Saccostrea cuccullata TaxID=36930 RepID=UPI002ED3CEF9
MLDKPHRIYNADETGFTMGSKAGVVVGPTRQRYTEDIPHLSGGSTKQRMTVMYCGNAEGVLLPPFFVYPKPQPTAYDPLLGATRGSAIHYTKKGWMDSEAFSTFIDHFHMNVSKNDRPVVLLIDSVSSHINMDIFTKARRRGIEIYRLVPNATHLMQPLDKGVFGPLKKEWYDTVRKNTRLNPDKPIDKKSFPSKLHETYVAFYKPSIIIGAFKGSGIYPVRRSAISNDRLKPSYTFIDKEEDPETEKTVTRDDEVETKAATEAFQLYSDTIGTPARKRYEQRLEEGWDVEGLSPGFTVYKKLKEKAHPPTISRTNPRTCQQVSHTTSQETAKQHSVDIPLPSSGLDLLACAALSLQDEENKENIKTDSNMPCSTPAPDTVVSSVSPALEEMTRLPKITNIKKPKPKKLISSLPYSLTSPDAIRQMALQELNFAREKAKKEKAAKIRYLKKKEKEAKANSSVKDTCRKRSKSKSSKTANIMYVKMKFKK